MNVKTAKLVIKKIKPQFPDTPEGNLMFAVVSQAIRDVASPTSTITISDQSSALRYLDSDMPHAAICGVQASWIRSIIKKIDNHYQVCNNN